MFSYIYWNPQRVAFNIFNFPVYWYSIFFAIGFYLGYQIFFYLIKKYLFVFDQEDRAKKVVDKLTTYVIVATILGARLGHILFYENILYYLRHPTDIFNLRQGGLASHGAAVFIILSLFILSKKLKKDKIKIGFVSLLDLLSIPASLAGCFIRIGNFFNQEILGKKTDVLWGVMFGSPLNEEPMVIRHPVQLYESFFYLILFFVLFFCFKKGLFLKKGKLIGIFLTTIFSFRIFIEFFKVKQSILLSSTNFLMGQYLSIPFVILGIFFLIRQDKALKVY